MSNPRCTVAALAVALAVSLLLAPAPAAAATDDVKPFLKRLCAALEKGDARAIRRVVKLPLPVKLITDERKGNPRTAKRTLRTVKAVKKADLCEGMAIDEAKVHKRKGGFSATVPRGQFDARLDLRPGKKGLKLVRFVEPAPK